MASKANHKKRLRRFFSSQELSLPGGRIELPAEETHHLKNILRLKPGDSCLLTDGSGIEVTAEIQSFLQNGRTLLTIQQRALQSAPKRPFAIRLIPALVKHGLLDEIVEKAQELGVDAFLAVKTERSDFDIKSEKENRVISRWEKKVREAAKQSGQLFLTNIEKPVALKETIQSIHPADRIAVFHPTECTHSFKEWLGELKSGFKDNQKTKPSLHLFFGPEGGFSAAEIAFLRQSAKELKAPLDIVGLGDSILRLETAVYSVTGAIRLIFG